MRRLGITLGLALVAVCATVGLSAPANATSAPVLYKQFTFPDACSSAGFAGAQNHQWVSYYCTTVFAAGPGFSYPGLYDLYVYYS